MDTFRLLAFEDEYHVESMIEIVRSLIETLDILKDGGIKTPPSFGYVAIYSNEVSEYIGDF